MSKVSKTMFLSRVAERAGVSNYVAEKVYQSIVEEIEAIMYTEGKLCLTGFGTFSLQRHKGHPVQFEGSAPQVADYLVFKFSASNVINHRLRAWDASLPEEKRYGYGEKSCPKRKASRTK